MNRADLKEELQVDNRLAEAEFAPVFRESQQSPFDRVVNGLMRPSAAFRGLLAARKLGTIIMIPLAISALLVVAAGLIAMSIPEVKEKSDIEFAEQIAAIEDDSSLSADQKEESIDLITSFRDGSSMAVIAVGGGAVVVVILVLIFGVVILIIAKILEPGRESYIKYGHAIAVACLAMVAISAASLTCIALTRFVGLPLLDPSLGVFVPESMPIVKGLASLASIPNIWGFVVAGIGTAMIARSRTPIAAAALVGAGLLVTVVLSAIGQAFSA